MISGGEIEGGSSLDPISELQSQEYALVLLSKRPNDWLFLNANDWTELYMQDAFEENKLRWLRVMRPNAKDLEQLPESLLEWTTTSIMIWDDLRPDQLTEAVQQGVMDWLYWGGTLIINGPTAIDQLRATPFETILPLTDTKLTEIPNESLAQMVENWTVKDDVSGAEAVRKIRMMGSVAGVSGTEVEGAEEATNTAKMVWRKRFGRGMVVMTRFNLDAPWMQGWRSNSAFMNGAVCQLPPRTIVDGRMVIANRERGTERSPHVVTNLRLFSRDADTMDPKNGLNERFAGWGTGKRTALVSSPTKA